MNWEGGAIVGCTNRAVMLAGENSILNLKGGYICGNTAVLGAGGAIQASGSSRIELSGTYISGNYVTVSGWPISMVGTKTWRPWNFSSI